MNLKRYYNKKVTITDTNDQVYVGTVSDYFYPEDNEPEVESIVIDSLDGNLCEFHPDNIKNIEVIN